MVQSLGGEQFFKLSYREFYDAIDAVLASSAPPHLAEFIKGYNTSGVWFRLARDSQGADAVILCALVDS